jgi:hypothetical protein
MCRARAIRRHRKGSGIYRPSLGQVAGKTPMSRIKLLLAGCGLLGVALVGMYGCGSEPATATLPPPSPTAVPPETPAALATGTVSGTGEAATLMDPRLILDAISKTETLTSYHFTLQANSDVFTGTVKEEGDYLPPDSAYVKGSFGDQQIEQLVFGRTVYVKDASGNWVERGEDTGASSLTALIRPTDLFDTADPIRWLAQYSTAVVDTQETGQDVVNGVSARHFTFKLDAGKLLGAPGQGPVAANMPPIGDGEIWIDPSKGFLHKVEMRVDLGPIVQMTTEAINAASGLTPTPGEATPTAVPRMNFSISITISRQNDPSLMLPKPQ